MKFLSYRGVCVLRALGLLISSLLLLSMARTALAQSAKAPIPPRRTAVGAVLGLSSSGLAMRHHWSRRWGVEFSAYSTFGSKFGLLALSTQVQLTLKQGMDYRLYGFVPLRWMYQREPTVHGINFGPDARVRTLHIFRGGLGLGTELFLGQFVALALELPVAVQLSTKPVIYNRLGEPTYQSQKIMAAPNVGLHVYFR